MCTLAPISVTCGTRTLTIRSGAPADAQALLDLAKNVFVTSPHTLTTLEEFTLTAEQEADLLSSTAAKDNSIFLAAFEDNTPLASLIIRGGEKKKERHLGTLGIGVHSHARGQGVGTALMQASLDWAAANPVIEMIKLAVYQSNTRAMDLYRRLGFVQWGLLPGGCKHSDGTYHDQIEMYKWVKPGKA
jgi:ribosomal protein S18 acetylase RimI-like enzyme